MITLSIAVATCSLLMNVYVIRTSRRTARIMRDLERCAECGVPRGDHKPPTMNTHYFRDPSPSATSTDEPRCGAPTPPAKDHATLFCQREEGHEPPHIVRGGGGQLLHKWSDDPAQSAAADAGRAMDAPGPSCPSAFRPDSE